MRVRSSSAPTVRRRANQRALSMASADRLDEAVEQLDVAGGEVVGRVVLDGEQPDERARAGSDGVEARAGSGARPGPPASAQVRLADDVPAPASGPLQRRRAASSAVEAWAGRRLPSRRTGTQSPSVLVEEQHGDAVEVEQVAQAADGRVEHLVEVERRRQRLGDPVQREQQGVGVGQAAEAVEGERLLAGRLPGDLAGARRW